MANMKFNEALGKVIRAERLTQSLTLRAVSQAGFISMGHLSDVERGVKEGSSSFIEGVATALGIEPYELIAKTAVRMAEAELEVPNSPADLFVPYSRDDRWLRQYADLVG